MTEISPFSLDPGFRILFTLRLAVIHRTQVWVVFEVQQCLIHDNTLPSLKRTMKAARVLQQTRRPTPTCLSQQARTRLHNNLSSAPPSPFSFLWLRNPRPTSIRRIPNKRFASSKSPFNPTPHLNSPEPSLSLSQRFKKLSREYGWSALGVYLLLTALDLPFCFLAVRWLGTERIGHWEHAILAWFWKIVPYPLPTAEEAHNAEPQPAGKRPEEYGVVASKGEEVGVPAYDHDVVEAEKRNKSEDASRNTLFFYPGV